MKRKAKAIVTFQQVDRLAHGYNITIRVPKRGDFPGVDIELEPTIVYGKTTVGNPDLPVMSMMDRMFEETDALFAALGKGFNRIFKLPPSK